MRRELGAGHLLSKLALAWLGMILLQALLGAGTIWSNKAADIATAHVLVGALSLAVGVMTSIIAFRGSVLARAPQMVSGERESLSPQAGQYLADSNKKMKATVQSLTPAVPVEKGWLAVYSDLFKARLTFLVLLTTLVGFYIGFRGPVDYLLMLETLFGTALVASGASALNQLMEQEYDAKMRRTQSRPLPSGRLQPRTVLIVGSVSAALGLIFLGLAVNLLTA